MGRVGKRDRRGNMWVTQECSYSIAGSGGTTENRSSVLAHTKTIPSAMELHCSWGWAKVRITFGKGIFHLCKGLEIRAVA